MYRKDIEQKCLNTLTKLIISDTEKKIYSKSFSDASNSSDIEEQIKYTLKAFDDFKNKQQKCIK